jgi:beta-exotoxin I transport system permease protein
MATNVFKREFKALLKSIVTWSLAVAALMLIFQSLYPSFSKQASQIENALSNYSPALRDAFGLNGDLASVLGFFAFIFLFIQICLAIQAAGYGFGLVSVEEREWTADFLLTRPVTRNSVLTAKLLSALAGMAITDVVLAASTFAFVSAFSGGAAYNSGTLGLALLSVIPFQLFFFFVGLAVSLLVRRIRNVMPYSLGLAFGLYVLSVFSDALGTSALEKVTPFKHFSSTYLIVHGNFDLALVLISIGVIIAGAVGSYVLYNRHDIPSVS